MIDCYTGVPGSGKSLHAASDIRFDLSCRRDIPVIANFRINPDAVRKPHLVTYMPNDQMSAGKLIDFACEWWDDPDHRFKEDGIHLYIDECQ